MWSSKACSWSCDRAMVVELENGQVVGLSLWRSGRGRDPGGTVCSRSECSPFVPFSPACIPTGCLDRMTGL